MFWCSERACRLIGRHHVVLVVDLVLLLFLTNSTGLRIHHVVVVELLLVADALATRAGATARTITRSLILLVDVAASATVATTVAATALVDVAATALVDVAASAVAASAVALATRNHRLNRLLLGIEVSVQDLNQVLAVLHLDLR